MAVSNVKNKHEYFVSPSGNKCVVCGANTGNIIKVKTNSVGAIDKNLIDINKVNLDDCVEFIRRHEMLSTKYAEEIKSRAIYYSSSNVLVGKLATRGRGAGLFSNKETTLWEDTPLTSITNYGLEGLLLKKSMFKFKNKKAAITKAIAKYNSALIANYSKDRDMATKSFICNDICLNLWLIKRT